LSHSAGHTRKYWVDLPLDQAGIKGTVNKTPMHATGSTFSYGRRYLVVMIFNISVIGEDDDGVAAGSKNGKATKKITKAQVKILENAIGPADESLYKAVTVEYGASSLAEIPADKFKDCNLFILLFCHEFPPIFFENYSL